MEINSEANNNNKYFDYGIKIKKENPENYMEIYSKITENLNKIQVVDFKN